tara:strand:+ start:1048 stop:1185 length:138 start_codon:yes stop_codon:yes gene_type:complete
MTEEQVKALIKQMIADGDLVIEVVNVIDNEETNTGHEELKLVAKY